jgi:hypothetical protein
MVLSSPTLLLVGPVLALSLHGLVLRRHEIDHLALPIIVTSCIVYGTLVYFNHFVPATLVATSFWGSLWLCIGTYRAFFHPLREYPGPFAARLSKWWTTKQALDSNLHLHRVQQQLQKEYGDYVRTGMSAEACECYVLMKSGPRELTIFDVNAISAIYGVQAKTTKGPFYDIMEKSLHLNRDKQFHRQRRRIWDNAFKNSWSFCSTMYVLG